MSNQNKYRCVCTHTIEHHDGTMDEHNTCGDVINAESYEKSIKKYWVKVTGNANTLTIQELNQIKADKEKLIKSQQTVTK